MEEQPYSSFGSGGTTLAVERVEIAAVPQIEPFECFVYVMSVLEGYSDLDCSLLLGCARPELDRSRNSRVTADRNAIELYLERKLNGEPQNCVSTGGLS